MIGSGGQPPTIYLATRPVDFRKGHDGLSAIVQETFGRDPFGGAVFVFRSKRADRIKILVFDGTGLALVAKVGSVEGQRRAAYARSQKSHDEALVALRAYEPLALEMFKLFQALSFHTDLALADVEAADEARVSPHAANAADLVRKILQEHKLGHSEAVTKWALAALHELELAAV